MKNKIITLGLASTMILGSASMAFAAPYDLVHRTDASKTYNFTQVAKSSTLLGNVIADMPNYFLESKDGDLYKASEVSDIMNADSSIFFDDAIKGLTPVELEKPVEGELKVTGVSAINATQVEVKFSVEVDKADAEGTMANYKIGANSPTSAVLQADEKTVLLTFSTPTHVEVTNAAVVVEPIQIKENSAIKTERYASLFTYEDTVKATVTAVESKTNSNIADTVKVEFSEPINSLGVVKINGVVKGATGFSAGDEEAIFTGLTLDSSQTHTLQIIGLTDQTANISDVINKTFTVTTDTVAPTVSLSASSDKDNVIIAEFDKAVTVATAQSKLVNGIVKDETLGSITSGTANPIDQVGSVAKKYEIAVTTPFTTLSTRNLTVIIPAGIKDALGNQVAATTKTVTLSKDTVAPEINSVQIIKDSDDKVTDLVIKTNSTLATKSAVIAATLKNSLTVVDSNGVLVDSSAWLGGLSQDAITAGDEKITLSFATPAKLSGEYTITFDAGLATDEAVTPNNLKAKTVTVDFGAASTTGTFTIVSGDVTSSGINAYDIDFGAAVKGGNVAGSATTLANYTLNGSALPAGTTITLNAGAKDTATITLPTESVETSDTGAVFSISNVQRSTGETIVPFTTTVAMVDNVKPVMTSATLATDNSLLVGFSEDLAAAPTVGDFVIKINGEAITTTPTLTAGSGSDAGKYVVDLDALVKNDSTQTYIDLDNDSIFNNNDILVKTEASKSSFSMKTSSIVSSLTIEVIGGTTTDVATNPLKIGTTITVK